MSNSCRVDLQGIAAITPPSLFAPFLSVILCVAPKSRVTQEPEPWCLNQVSMEGLFTILVVVMSRLYTTGCPWVEMDRHAAGYKLCVWIIQCFVAGRSLLHVKVGHKWAHAISKALHLTEGASWQKCQWGHWPRDWQEKISHWRRGLRAPAVLRNLLQKDCFASSPAWKLMRQISKEFIATFKTFGHNIKDSAGKETDWWLSGLAMLDKEKKKTYKNIQITCWWSRE